MQHALLPHSLIGFEHLFDLLDRAAHSTPKGFPPTNIVGGEAGRTTIEMAVAGFRDTDLSIEHTGDRLRVSGQATPQAQERSYLHRGIANRSFERVFALAPHMVVTGATLDHGILSITLEQRIPEALQPRRIPIQGTLSQPTIEASADATA